MPRLGHTIALAAGPLACAAVYLLPTPAGLSPAGQAALAVLALCLPWWVFAPVQLPVTSLVGLALLPLLGALAPQQAVALFGNQAVFFIIGVFLVAAATFRTGLSSRVTLLALRRFAKNEDALCNGVLVLSWGLCAVVVSHAVAALMLPIVLEILHALELRPRSRTAKRLLLSLAWGTVAGSNLTLLSSARATLALQIYSDFNSGGASAAPIGFLEYSLGSVPMAIAALVLAAIALRIAFPPEGIDLRPAIAKLADKVQALGPTTRGEWLTSLTVAAMVVSLVLYGAQYGLGTIAMLFAGLLFVMRVLDWEDAERYVNWGVVLLYGGAIAIGAALHQTGGTAWALSGLSQAGPHGWIVLIIVAVAATFLTEIVSNSAIIALLLPISLQLAQNAGLDPRIMAWTLPLCAGFAFMLPTSTPAMALVFGTGYLRARDTLVGLIVSVLALLSFFAIAAWVWPLFGLHVFR